MEIAMKKLTSVSLGIALAGALAAGNAVAKDAKNGGELTAACQTLLDEGPTPGSQGEICKNFLVSLVKTQEESLTMGEPFRAQRLGAKGDETACFELPKKLTFRDFARQVVSFSGSNPDLGKRPAEELAVKALQENYPCDPVYLQKDNGTAE